MTKVKSLHIYGTPERINEVKSDLDYTARNAYKVIDSGHIQVFPRSPKFKDKRNPFEDDAPRKVERRKGNGHNRTA